ncbi:transglutaminase domain-containing protein [Plantactinospora sp. WMMC1484]|uniref:transglutaminase domain-containing protein n=1 Tax=Plantactinospora sp. WMMC1484 TaxID=3404122 RepID=UPI003BF4F301
MAVAGGEPVTGADLTPQIAEVVSTLRRIPMSARRFTVPAAEVFPGYRLSPTVLASAVAAGFPRVGTGEDALYDQNDLANLALYLPLPTLHRAAMRFWARVLDRPDREERTYRVSYRGACPAPGHPGPCMATCHEPDDLVTPVPVGAGHVFTHDVDVVLRNDWPALPPPLAALAREVADIRFFRLPEVIHWDVDFATANLVADCAAYAKLLVIRGAELGYPARIRHGLMVAAPFSMPHFWAEFRLAERWVPCDPGLVIGMVSWGVLPADRWTPDRSVGALLAGFSTRSRALMLHNNRTAIDAKYPTRLLNTGAGEPAG